ncbi:lytic transglycosylase F, partial [Rhizobiaceae sp. 2RAB30]
MAPRVASAEETSVTSLPGIREWTGDFDGMEKRRIIRMLVPYSKTIYFIDRGRQLGTAVEFGQALETWIDPGNKKEDV